MVRLIARRGALVTVVAVTLLLSACGGSSHNKVVPPGSTSPRSSSNVTSPATTPSTTAVPAQAACMMPLTHDTYDGFHIAVPAGWDLSALQGRIEVKKDAAESEAVVVEPAVQTSSVNAGAYFTSALQSFRQQVQNAGGTFSVTGQSSSNGLPQSSITVTAPNLKLEGKAMLMVVPMTTQLSKTELAFVLYWARGSLAGVEPMLQSIAQCFGPEKGSLFNVVRDQVFTYELAPGWGVTDESQDALDLHHGTDASVSYVLASVPQQYGASTQSFIDYVLAHENVTGVTAISTFTGAESTEYEEFIGTLNGQAIHGLISSGQPTPGPLPTAGIRQAVANQSEWNSMAGGLVQMAGFIQHGFSQDLQTINQLNQQWQNFNGQVANFDDTLNNQQLVQDPTNGKLYEAPYSAYTTGPAGPGYYVDNGFPGGQRLNEVQRG